MSMSVNVGIKSDTDISLSMTIGIDNTYMTDIGYSDLCQALTDEGGTSGLGLPGNVSMTPGSSNGQSTCTMAATGMSLSDLGSDPTSGTSLTHANGEYTFTMDLGGDSSDLSGAGISASDVASMINPFAISVTFPGAVVSSTPQGTVSGNTVTWSDPSVLLSSTPLTAVGKDSGGAGVSASGVGGLSWPIIIGIIVGVIIIAAIIIAVVMSSSRKKKAQAAAAQAQYAQAGYGVYPTMPQYAPQPTYGQPAAPDSVPPAAPFAAPAMPVAAPMPVPQPMPAPAPVDPAAVQFPVPQPMPAPAPVDPQPVAYPVVQPMPVPAPVDPAAVQFPVPQPMPDPVQPMPVPQPAAPVDPYQPPAQHAQPDPYGQPPAPPMAPPPAPPVTPYGQ